VIDFKLSESSWGIFMHFLVRFGVQFCSGDPAFGRTLGGAIGSTLFIGKTPKIHLRTCKITKIHLAILSPIVKAVSDMCQ
jgi:hypothetical protein